VDPVSSLVRAFCSSTDLEKRERAGECRCLAEKDTTVSHGAPRSKLCLLPRGHLEKHEFR